MGTHKSDSNEYLKHSFSQRNISGTDEGIL